MEPGFVVRLTFNTFSIEDHPNCVYDSVSVFDGPGIDGSNMLGR